MKKEPVILLMFFWFTVLAIICNHALHVDLSMHAYLLASFGLTMASLGLPAFIRGVRQGMDS